MTKDPGDFRVDNTGPVDPHAAWRVSVHEQLPHALSTFFDDTYFTVDDRPTLNWLKRGVNIVGTEEVIAECRRMMQGEPERYDADWRRQTG